ncbi:MAG: hypothetical protein GXO77_04305 [Calditrichaeota bacterium]|nr:hypothetical protein [Calditrichota bacterium]
MKRLLFLILAGSLFFSCQDLNSIDPPDEFKVLDRFGTFIDTTFVADSAFFVTDPYINTENSVKLSLGSYRDFNSSFLIRFTRMPSDSGASYDSVFVILRRKHVFGDKDRTLKINVFPLENSWPDSVNVLPEWHNYQPGQPVYSFDVAADDTTEIVIPVPNDVFNTWVEQGADNNGLLFSPSQPQDAFILELNNFYSEKPEDWPKLVYKTILDTLIEHDTTNIGIASTVYDYDFGKSENIFSMAKEKKELIVSSGIAGRILVHFGALNSLPKKSILYKADIQFAIKDEDFFDPGLPNSLDNKDHSNYFYLRIVSSMSEDGSSFEIDSAFAKSSYFSYSLKQDQGIIHFANESDQVRFGKGFVQDFVNERSSSTWFYLQFQNEFQDLSIKRIKSVYENGVQLRVRYYSVESEGF